MRNIFVDTVADACKKNRDIFILSEDAGLGVFDRFKENSPGRFLNMGIAEQNATSFAAGMSLAGFKVYLYNIIPFLLYRPYEQVRNDICYQKLPVVLVGTGSGVTYAPQGVTHYAVEDLGIARTLPNLTVLSPADPVEARLSALYSLDCPGPVYVRLAKTGEAKIHKKADFDIREPQLIEDGEDAGIIFHGSISAEVMQAGEILRRQGIHPKLISLPMVQPLHIGKLSSLLKNLKSVVSVEEHFVNSGLGSVLLNAYAAARPHVRISVLGIPCQFIHEIKDRNGMRDYFGISARKIADDVSKNIKAGRVKVYA